MLIIRQLFLFVLVSNAGFATSSSLTRSSKKGVVIPNWPRHHCFDFELFTTIRWKEQRDLILAEFLEFLPAPDQSQG